MMADNSKTDVDVCVNKGLASRRFEWEG